MEECVISSLESDDHQLLVAEENGEVVGYLSLQLLKAAEERARSTGCFRLMLNNRLDAQSFQRDFYPKNGFQRREVANFVKALN